MAPLGLTGGGSLQGSVAEVSGKVAAGARTRVGNGVKVGAGVNVTVGVGGMGVSVAVGIAACVMVIASQACSTAVPCKSATDIVGAGVGPHADNIAMTKIEITAVNFLFIFFLHFQFAVCALPETAASNSKINYLPL
jgi:hypothetical protein